MNEGAPKTPNQSELQKTTMEGNVRMPQVTLGIVMNAAQYCFSKPNPAKAIEDLLAPIPNGEGLQDRTNKANAQHVLYGINRTLNTEDVQRIELAGNLETFRFIMSILGKPIEQRQVVPIDADGSWAPPELFILAKEAQQELTLEKAIIFKKTLEIIQNYLKEPAVVERLKERKKFFYGHGEQDKKTREENKEKAKAIGATITDEISQKLARYQEEDPSVEKKKIVERVVSQLDSFM